jgi:hypothetical protein
MRGLDGRSEAGLSVREQTRQSFQDIRFSKPSAESFPERLIDRDRFPTFMIMKEWHWKFFLPCVKKKFKSLAPCPMLSEIPFTGDPDKRMTGPPPEDRKHGA